MDEQERQLTGKYPEGLKRPEGCFFAEWLSDSHYIGKVVSAL